MFRYFIKLNAPYFIDDREGDLYGDLNEARKDAVGFLADLLSDRTVEVKPGEDWTLTVYDVTETPVFVLNLTAR